MRYLLLTVLVSIGAGCIEAAPEAVDGVELTETTDDDRLDAGSADLAETPDFGYLTQGRDWGLDDQPPVATQDAGPNPFPDGRDPDLGPSPQSDAGQEPPTSDENGRSLDMDRP